MMTYAELDAIRDDASRADDRDILLSVEELVEAGGELPTLVSRYADARNPGLVRVIAFFVARASEPEKQRDTAALVWDLVVRLRVDDTSARVNMLTAILMVAMWLRPLVAPLSLYPFLLHSLDLDPLVQSGVAQTFGSLYWKGGLAQWPREYVDTLRARLRALRDPAGDSLLQAELADLDFLDD